MPDSLEGEHYVLEDLGSSNGTFVNGEKLVQRRILNSGDKIRLGQIINLVYSAPFIESNKTVMHSSEPDKTVMHSAEPDKTVARAAPAKPAYVMQTIMGEAPVAPSSAGPRQLLVTIAGGSTQTVNLTRPTFSIGRLETNDIVIPSQIVSSKHARLEQVEGGGYKLVVDP
jgi:pSer/pThr/pTyr-binding forkhead associated (FHA) protein